MLFVSIGSFMVFIVVVYLVAAPLARRDRTEDEPGVSALVLRKDQLLSDIRELDMDLATGKLEEQDHQRLRAATLVAAVDTMKAIEEAEPVGSDTPQADDAVDEDTRLEAMIAARKLALEASACPSCGSVSDPADAFCRRCGSDLSAQRVG